jgi:hypothetical protein
MSAELRGSPFTTESFQPDSIRNRVENRPSTFNYDWDTVAAIWFSDWEPGGVHAEWDVSIPLWSEVKLKLVRASCVKPGVEQPARQESPALGSRSRVRSSEGHLIAKVKTSTRS